MSLAAPITRLLADRLGLSADLLGFVAVERALDIVLGTAGAENRERRIAHLLQGEGEEWEMLVDEVIVPETWFFRDRGPFQLLASHVKEKWRPANPTGYFRVLSIPCASGEEPYSVAMALLEAGLEADRIRIDAGDVSERALARARQGVYRKNSFREKSGYLGKQYFLSDPGGWRVREDVAALVRFEKANLLDLSAYQQRAPYMAVFCRNALIYLEDRAQREVIASLHDLVEKDGLLFTGHSELMTFLKAGYQRVDHPQSFACRKAGPRLVAPGSSPERAPTSQGPTPPETEAAATIHLARKRRRIALAVAGRPLKAPLAAPPPASIEEAGQLADRGELGAATTMCERLLAEGTQDPEVYSLLGVISECGEKLEAAEDLFRKALFLDPDHYQSLLHMSLLYERRGDIDGSHLYRAHAGRVLSRQERDRVA
jgi:chemotaxis protein methyltransferase WspC